MTDFSSDFVWGVSTSAYQIEGAHTAGGRGESIWDRFSHTPGRIADGSTGDVAIDHYNRLDEDVDLLAQLGSGAIDGSSAQGSRFAYRFSLSWPRLMPEGRGRVAKAGVDFYDRLLDRLAAAGVSPWVCLYHWDLPQALQDRGGWTNRDMAFWFADYAEFVAASFGDRVGTFLMLNEPNVHALLGHMTAIHAPGLEGMGNYLAAVHHQNLAVGQGLLRLREMGAWKLGTVVNLQPIVPATDGEDDVAAASLADQAFNRANLDPLLLGEYPQGLAMLLEMQLRSGDLEIAKQPVDFVGVNHYAVQRVAAGHGPIGVQLLPAPAGAEVTGMGWSVDPQAFTRQLLKLKECYGNPPVVITENGAAFTDPRPVNGRVADRARTDYLRRYIQAMAEAIQAGCNVRGYFVWTLVDNFEWADGFSKRFGLVHLDLETLKRTPKDSFRFYQQLIASNSVPD